MARKLTLSTMFHNPDMTQGIQDTLQRFNHQYGVETAHQEMDYASAWSEFIRLTLQGGGIDVSEMGTSWVNDFAGMNALRPLRSEDALHLGGSEALGAFGWGAADPRKGPAWGVPWMLDVSLVYYRRDLLAQAGVEETGAFATPPAFEETLRKLQAAGVENPWSVVTQRSYITLHNLAMWIWQAGGEFVDASGKTVLLDQSPAREALRAYFGLYRYLSPAACSLTENGADDMFCQGKAAVTIGGPWLMRYCMQHPQVADNLGLALPLGNAYIGGSSLVVWKQTIQERRALDLIAWLTSQEFQQVFPAYAGLLPARQDALHAFPLANKSMYDVISQALQSGHLYPQVPLWGMIEERLVNAAAGLWLDLLSIEQPDVDALLDRRFLRVVERLNITLSQR